MPPRLISLYRVKIGAVFISATKFLAYCDTRETCSCNRRKKYETFHFIFIQLQCQKDWRLWMSSHKFTWSEQHWSIRAQKNCRKRSEKKSKVWRDFNKLLCCGWANWRDDEIFSTLSALFNGTTNSWWNNFNLRFFCVLRTWKLLSNAIKIKTVLVAPSTRNANRFS